jgi:ribokinase
VAGRVGDDDFGRMFLAALDREGIDRRAVVVDPIAGTGVASIIVEPDGTNTIVQAPRANRNVTANDIERAATGLVGASVAMMQLETSAPGVISFATAAHFAGALTVLNPAPAAVVGAELFSLIDVLVPNEIEAAALTHASVSSVDLAFAAVDALQARGPDAVVITLGEKGAVGRARDERVRAAAAPVHVLDTVGAGDAFCAALAVRLAEGAAFAEAMYFANAAGALACTKQGAEPSMPTRDEVEALLQKGPLR